MKWINQIYTIVKDHSLQRLQASGDERSWTADLLRAKQMLSQTELHPHRKMMGLSGVEPETSRLSGARSNRLSYKPSKKKRTLKES